MWWKGKTSVKNECSTKAVFVDANDSATTIIKPSPAEFSKPPTYPTAPLMCEKRPAEKENMHDPSKKRCPAEEMRSVPVLGFRGPRKDLHSPWGSQSVSGALEELEGILTYVESVTESLSHRTRAPIPPEKVRMVSNPMVTLRRGVNVAQCDDAPQCSLAVGLHDNANALLSWLAKLEYLSFSQNLSLQDMEKNVKNAATAVGAVLDSVELRYQNHEIADVQEFFAGSRLTLEECQRAVRSLLQIAQQILVLRRFITARDLTNAKAMVDEYKNGRHREGMKHLHSTFFIWVENKWFPAMEAWNRIVESVHKQASLGDVSEALARGQQEALAQSDMISEILHPDETLSDLVQKNIEEPLARVANTLKIKCDAIDALHAALAAPNSKRLSLCVCAVEKLAADGKLTLASDQELLKEGKRVIIRLQQVENICAALQLAVRMDDTLTLFRTIHQANEIILQLGIAGDVATNEKVVSHGNAILREMSNTESSSPSEFIASRVDPTSINVVHVPSRIWTAETAAAYQAACQHFTTRAAQDLVLIRLRRLTNYDGTGALNSASGSIGDDTSNSSSVSRMARFAQSQQKISSLSPEEVRELRATLEHAKKVGLRGKIVQDVETCLLSVNTLKLKLHFEAQLRVVKIQEPEKVTFEEVYQKVFEVCMQQPEILPRPVGQKLRLRYQDTDGDCISLLTQEDWNVFLSEQAPHGVCGAKLDLFCDFPPVPHAHVADRVLSPPRFSSETAGDEPEAPPMNAPRAVPTSSPAKTFTRVSLLTPMRRDVKGAEADALKNSRQTRSRSVGFGLTRSNKPLSHSVAVKQKSFDDMHLQKPRQPISFDDERLGDGGNAVMAVQGEQATAKRENKMREDNKNGAPHPVSRGRCRVSSVRLNHFSPKPSRAPPLLTAGEKKNKTPLRMVPAPAPPVSSSSSTAAAATASTTPSTTPVGVKLVTAKEWKEDDAPFELQTVVSLVSTMPPSANNRMKKNNTKCNENANAKAIVNTASLTGKQHGNGFTVTKCAKNTAVNAKPRDPLFVGEKREWSADMFMLSDIHTVVSDRTSPPQPPSKNNRQKMKQGTTAPRCDHSERCVTVTEVESAPTSSSTTIIAKKMEVLQQLRQLREENQKAMKIALYQRQKGK